MSLPTLILCLLPLALPRAAQDIEIPEDTEIQTTESGLKYSVLRPGTGDVKPGPGDRVLVHFTGWLEDGTLIMSSRTTGKPLEVGVGQQRIKGLNEGLQLLSQGGRVKLTIPPELGYGDRGRGKIPAGATLVYEVELIEITARVPDFLPLDEAESEQLDSGLRVQWLHRGDGWRRDGSSSVWVDYTYWDTLGECHFATIMTPSPVILAPGSAPFKFFGQVLDMMGEGDEALFEVPPELLFGDRESGKLPPNSVTIWRIKIVRVLRKPEFPAPKREDFEEMSTGVLRRTVVEGHGKPATRQDRVRMHYTGWLTDGREVATSYDKKNQPLSTSLADVIPGMCWGMETMKEGGVLELVIPGPLAYGEKGRRPLIPPDATLVYTVELIQVY